MRHRLLLRVGAALVALLGTALAAADTARAAGSWSAAAPMAEARVGGTATLLPSGQVLVVGGDNTGGVVGTTERFDPMSNSWQPAAALARSGHTATLLKNGTVLVIGGKTADGTPTTMVEQYSPGANTWTFRAFLPTARSGHTATLLNDGRVLVTGGEVSAADATSAVYDPVANSWGPACCMTARASYSATRLADGRVIVAGGYNPASAATLDSVEIFSPATNSWSAAAALPQPRSHHVAALLPSGRVLVAGGLGTGVARESAVLYDSATDAWTNAADMNEGRTLHTAALLANGQVMVAGGYIAPADSAHVELFDESTNTWSLADDLVGPREDVSLTAMFGGKMLAAGGVSWDFAGPVVPTVHATAETYQADTLSDVDGDGYDDALEVALNLRPRTFCATLRADVNFSAQVNIIDLQQTAQQVMAHPPLLRMDQNATGGVDVIDLMLIALQAGKAILSCP